MIIDLIKDLQRGADIRDVLPGILFTIIVVLFSLSFHEMSHAFAAYKMGDRTAKNLGRLSLNPASHLDPLGTICMMLFGFGWAKPVPINSRNFRNPRKGILVTSAAGPLSNLILSFTTLLIYEVLVAVLPTRFLSVDGAGFAGRIVFFLLLLLCYFHVLNLYLAFFNLIPVPPLDGSKILMMFLPSKVYFFVHQYEHIIRYVLLALLFTGILSKPLSYVCILVSNGMSWLIHLIPGI